MSLEALAEELGPRCGVPAPELREQIYELTRHQVAESMQAVKSHLKFHKYTFELVGYDFMLI